MPLSRDVRRSLNYSIATIGERRLQKYSARSVETRKILREILVEYCVTVINNNMETLNSLESLGIDILTRTRWNRVENVISLDLRYGELGILGFPKADGERFPNLSIEHKHITNPKWHSLCALLDEESDRISTQRDQANKLCTEIIESYSNVNYMFTQFPEVKVLIPEHIDPQFKPNPYYKLKTRDKFENCEAITILLGNAIMEGIQL